MHEVINEHGVSQTVEDCPECGCESTKLYHDGVCPGCGNFNSVDHSMPQSAWEVECKGEAR